MKAYWDSGCIVPHFLHLDTGRRWVVSFTPQPLYPQGSNSWHPSDRRLGGPQSQSGHSGGEEKNSQPLSGLESPIIQPEAQRCTTELSRLHKTLMARINSSANRVWKCSENVWAYRVIGEFRILHKSLRILVRETSWNVAVLRAKRKVWGWQAVKLDFRGGTICELNGTDLEKFWMSDFVMRGTEPSRSCTRDLLMLNFIFHPAFTDHVKGSAV
jgi:hypothetical protein